MRLLGFGRLLPDAAWSQWQPTLTAHDPDPPLPLESVPVVTPAVGGVLDLFRLNMVGKYLSYAFVAVGLVVLVTFLFLRNFKLNLLSLEFLSRRDFSRNFIRYR